MKAVFPCKGVVVVTKQNVDILSKIYQENLINSPLFSAYNQGNNVQVGPFNYLPENTKFVLRQNTELLTIQELNKVLTNAIQKPVTDEKTKDVEYDYDTPIEDSSIMEHPFFQTLKQID